MMKYYFGNTTIMKIIVPSKELIFDLYSDLKCLGEIKPNREFIIEELIPAISFEARARRELDILGCKHYAAFSLIDPKAGGPVYSAITTAGDRLKETLKIFNMYWNGYLVFQPIEWCGYDIVFERLSPEDIPCLR